MPSPPLFSFLGDDHIGITASTRLPDRIFTTRLLFHDFAIRDKGGGIFDGVLGKGEPQVSGDI